VSADVHSDELTQPGRTNGHELKSLLRALRPRQWTKNLLVFLAPAAAGDLHHGAIALRTLAIFGIFCAAASGSYLINDAIDVEADRLHPVKRNRPIASGTVRTRFAFVLGTLLLALALCLAWALVDGVLVITIAAYGLITVSYSLWLKREPVVELVAVAAGFVIRAIAGAVGNHVPLSSWFLVVVSFGALFVVSGKRAAELHNLSDDRIAHRPVLADYTTTFIQSVLTLSATVTVTGYCLWAFERIGISAHVGHRFIWIELSVIPVVLGVLHVLRLLDAGKGGAPEDLVFHDRVLQVTAVIWAIFVGIAIYA
jgi:decaprenyl-phosphate phosphoribosyltransferase